MIDYNCNWLGGQVVATEIDAPGYASAGFANISTSDGIVHGQVKQAGNFGFARIYESGHEVPFYQPLAALEIFERVLCGRDVATGQLCVSQDHVLTDGPSESLYREGNATVVPDFLPLNATYNTTLNGPDGVVMDKRATKLLGEGWNRKSFGERAGSRGEMFRESARTDGAGPPSSASNSTEAARGGVELARSDWHVPPFHEPPSTSTHNPLASSLAWVYKNHLQPPPPTFPLSLLSHPPFYLVSHEPTDTSSSSLCILEFSRVHLIASITNTSSPTLQLPHQN
nr:carboxypeptidase s1 like a [Quercus suber]